MREEERKRGCLFLWRFRRETQRSQRRGEHRGPLSRGLLCVGELLRSGSHRGGAVSAGRESGAYKEPGRVDGPALGARGLTTSPSRWAIGTDKRERPGGSFRSSGFLNLAGLDALGADLDSLSRPFYTGPNALKVGPPTTLGLPVGMADEVAHDGALVAYEAASGHDFLRC